MMVDRHVYTLTEAARATGMTRQGVLAAIRRGTVSANKNAQGLWEIDPAELHRVYAPVAGLAMHVNSNFAPPVTSPVTSPTVPGDAVTASATAANDLAELQKRLAVAEALLSAAHAQAESALRERDAWKDQAHEWMRMSQNALPEGEVKQKRGFWARIFTSHGS